MFSYIYHTFIFTPLYNGLIFLMDILPWIDAGIAVVILTIIVRLILFPLSKKAIVTQVRMKEVEPELNRIKKNISNKQEQAMKMLELYRSKGIKPFSSFFLLFIQLPIIFALYSIFIKSGLPAIQENLLYSSFVSVPDVDMFFLGLLDIGKKSLPLSLIAAISQYFQLHYSFAVNTPVTKSNNPSLDIAQSMTKNMKYVFPIMVFFISYHISAAIALYWTVSNLFTLGQELVIRRHLKKHQPL